MRCMKGGRGFFAACHFRVFVAGLILFSAIWAASPSLAETRRAFVVGVQRYSDGTIQQLSRSANDARDLARDLEEIGFDKKNIKVVVDPRSKDAFNREFNTFLKTVQPGDTVLFFFAGHGFGLEADQTNYLLFGDLKSPFAYTRSQVSDRNADLVRLRVASYLSEYQTKEIPRSGISVSEIEERLAERKPANVIMILDACRSLVTAEGPDTGDRRQIRGGDSGSRLVTARQPPSGFLTLYSAAFGEQAVESFGSNDRRRNSLFTEVLRSELQRPGQSLVELAERVRLVVRAIAQEKGQQQEPEYAHNLSNVDDFMLVGSIGRERFQVSEDRCTGGTEDWDQIKTLGKRELFERHRRRFDSCRTAEFARRALIQLAMTADDPIDTPVLPVNRSVNECDRLAASEYDRARPPEVPGVPFDKLEPETAISACTKAIEDNPRIVRFLFNLGRAYQKAGVQPGGDASAQSAALRRARLVYEDAAERGYVSALSSLAVLYENGDGVEIDEAKAAELLKRAAQQGHTHAMYNLALHYRNGTLGIRRDFAQAYEWFAKSAESGFVSAMVELGDALRTGRGLSIDRNNPRRAVEWYQRAAEAGSTRAKLALGLTYLLGREARGDSSNSVPPDVGLALLWLARVADSGESTAQFWLALMMQEGVGLPNPQPEIAERYWRLAAHGGSSDAQVAFAERLHRGFVLIRPEFGAREAINLLERAMSQGSPQASLRLAQIYRNGELGQPKKPVEAMRLAYRTIALAVQANPNQSAGNPFHEIAAAHLLVEMARGGEAIDAGGRPLLTEDEIERLERFYGAVDPVSKQVKVRRLDVRVSCGNWNPRVQPLWVWDWGRAESPTEPQFRNIERDTGCTNNDVLRRTLIDVFEQARKNQVAFADLIDQKIKTANTVVEPKQRTRR